MTQRAMSRRDFMHVATATSVGALIAACAPAAAPSAGDDGGGAAAMEEVTIEFWVNQPMARSEGLWDTLMAEYEEINPGVTVSSLIIPHRDYEPKVLTGLAGGTVGDLLDVHPMHNATMAMRGALMPLDELMPTLGVSEDEMTKAWDYNVWRGKRWAIPRSDNPTIMLYNRSMVAEAGMDDPAELWAEGKWDIEAFDNTMDAVSGGEGEDRVYGCALPGGGTIRMQCVWIWGNDATVWNADETASAFNSPKAIEAWEYMTGAVARGWAPTPAESNIPGGWVAMMGQRRLCMQWPGAQFVLGGQAQFIPEDVMSEMQLVPLNTLWNGNREVRNATNSHGIYLQTDHVDESWAMCQYLISDDAQFRIIRERWTSPMVKRHAESEAWLGSLEPNLETAEMWEDSFNNIRAFSHLPRQQEMDNLIQAAKDRIILGDATAQEAMDAVAAEVDAIIAEVEVEIQEAGL